MSVDSNLSATSKSKQAAKTSYTCNVTISLENRLHHVVNSVSKINTSYFIRERMMDATYSVSIH